MNEILSFTIGAMHTTINPDNINSTAFQLVTQVHNVAEPRYSKKFIEKAIRHCLNEGGNSKPLNLHHHDRIYKQQFIFEQYIKQQGNATFKAVDDPAGYNGEFMRIVAGLEIPPLMAAAAIDNKCLLKKLLRGQHDVNAIDAQGRTPLMYAGEFESAGAFELLLRNAADPAKCCQQGRNALFYATRHGSEEMVKQLKKFTDDLAMRNMVMSQDHSGLNAIMLAAELETPEILKLFLMYQPDIKIAAVGHGNKTAAMFAAEKGRLKTLNALIDYDEAGAQELIMARDASGKTVLSYASTSNNLGITNLLCSLGARYDADELKAVNVDFSNVKRRNLFDGYLVEQKNGEYKAVSHPTGVHGDFIRPVADKMIPALFATAAKNDMCLLRELLSKGVNVNDCDSQGRTALMYAAEFGSLEALTFLLEQGADQLAVCRQKKIALMYAVQRGHIHLVENLLKIEYLQNAEVLANAEILVNMQDNTGLNTVMLAAQGVDVDIMKALLFFKPNLGLRAIEHRNKTAVMFAAEYGRVAILKVLLNYAKPFASALVTAEDSHGNNVMSYGLASENPAVVDLLVANGAKLTASSAFIDINQRTLEYALHSADTETINLFLRTESADQLASIFLSQNALGTDLLMYSVKHFSQAKIKSFIGSMPSDNIPALLATEDAKGLTYLHYAIKKHAPVELFEWLLLMRFPLHQNGQYKKLTRLMNYAIKQNNLPAVNSLLSYRKNRYLKGMLAARNKNGETALRIAVTFASHTMVDYLLNAGAYQYPNILKTNQSLEMAAAKHGDEQILAKLIAYRIEKKLQKLTDIINERDSQGRDIMMYAAMGGNPDIMTFLHEKGASLTASASGDNQLTPLLYAVLNQRPSAVGALLRLDASLHTATDDFGRTALMLAARSGNTRIVTILLTAGADAQAVAARDHDKTAWHYAQDKGNADVISLLERHAAKLNRAVTTDGHKHKTY